MQPQYLLAAMRGGFQVRASNATGLTGPSLASDARLEMLILVPG